MRTVFADTFYWVALANPTDEWHKTVTVVSRTLVSTKIVTTDEVLTEFLTLHAGSNRQRSMAAELVHRVMADSNVRTLPQTRASFAGGLRLFESRNDKTYSLTDCISMEVMREQGLHEILTHDHHFTQDGFTILFPEKIVA